MTTNLFVIANVKQLRTGGSFRILWPFFRTSTGVGVLNSAIFNSFHNRVEFGTILYGLRNFWGGGLNPLKPPPSVRHCSVQDRNALSLPPLMNIVLPAWSVRSPAKDFLREPRTELASGQLALVIHKTDVL